MKPIAPPEPPALSAESSPNPERRGLKKGLYLIPFSFTTANILMGFMSIMESMRAFQLLAGRDPQRFAQAAEHFDLAAVMIGFAVIFDALDGRIARLTKTTTEIGVQFDSIADVLTFVLVPAGGLFVYALHGSLETASVLALVVYGGSLAGLGSLLALYAEVNSTTEPAGPGPDRLGTGGVAG